MNPSAWERAKALLADAAALPAANRERFVIEHCSDPEVRREVLELLDSPAPLTGIVAGHALQPGARLGPYTIEALLGSGGMGEVYRARDNTLNRSVAIKVLPDPLANDPERLSRFRREAQILAALNHPNIAHIHGFEEFGGVATLVMELVDGSTLADAIARHALTLTDALPIARQIADALDAAHGQGIVHRDLKPANIKVREDGTVKVLDFGLAKALALTIPSGTEAVNSPAAPVHSTQAGLVMGTAPYMAPEQALGKTVDKRADIWSFGCVLFEMLSGRRAFAGQDISDTLSLVIGKDPDWTALPSNTPAPIGRILRQCLHKDRSRRLADIADARLAIDEALSPSSEASLTPPPASGRAVRALRRRAAWYLAATVVGAAAVAGGMFFATRSRPPDQSDYRFTPFSFEPGGQSAPVWSPNGSAVAYAARPVLFGPAQIFVRYLNAASPLQLTHGSQSAFPLAWSRDGARVLVTVWREPFGISTVPTVGGEPELLTRLPGVWPAAGFFGLGRVAIHPDKTVVATLHADAGGVESVWITAMSDGSTVRYSPEPFATKVVENAPTMRFSPDGKHLLLMLNGGQGEDAWLLDYPGGGTARARRVFSDTHGFNGTPEFSWMPDSRHIVMSYQPAADARVGLWLVDTETGSRHALTSGTTDAMGSAVSPNGTQLILTELRADYDVVSVDLATGTGARLIATDRNEWGPSWATAVSELAYVTDRNGTWEIWLHEPNKIDRPVVTATDFPAGTTQWLVAPALSPDGTRIVYTRVENGSTTSKLWISGVAGGTPIRLTDDPAIENPGSWSEDGAWFVYECLHDGRTDLMKVKATGGQATPILVKADTKDESVPSWSPAGNWIAAGDRLISPDGRTEKRLGGRHSRSYVFTADGRFAYGIESSPGHDLLFRVDVATNADTVVGDVGREFRPAADLGPSIRLSLAPDGKTVAYSTFRTTSSLWLLRGFAARPGILARLGFQ